jgi:hypothetical protein
VKFLRFSDPVIDHWNDAARAAGPDAPLVVVETYARILAARSSRDDRALARHGDVTVRGGWNAHLGTIRGTRLHRRRRGRCVRCQRWNERDRRTSRRAPRAPIGG